MTSADPSRYCPLFSTSEVKKTYDEEERRVAQRQHAASYAKKAALFRSELREAQDYGKYMLMLTAVVFIGMAGLSKLR